MLFLYRGASSSVEKARVETLAGICSSDGQKSWAEQNMDLAALKGWDNRMTREELGDSFDVGHCGAGAAREEGDKQLQ